ncbi:MAG: Holliday junction resolvase RuvX [Flavobacteriaceae bacterium]|jgi:RNAse H domain protein, YqgF family|nr:Holliday junction resolvase RuvX [Flavobacteriaceae bacterium]
MGQILAVDFGKKRCGLAATDDLRIIASGLDTVETSVLMEYLKKYFEKNTVDEVVIGLPTDLKGNMSEVEQDIQKFIEELKNEFPEVSVERFDERFTSKIASYFISQSGKNKKQRQEKGLIDKVSATLILQQYLEQKL